jgi:hypothetical protein
VQLVYFTHVTKYAFTPFYLPHHWHPLAIQNQSPS